MPEEYDVVMELKEITSQLKSINSAFTFIIFILGGIMATIAGLNFT